jgi:hypothetical protein
MPTSRATLRWAIPRGLGATPTLMACKDPSGSNTKSESSEVGLAYVPTEEVRFLSAGWPGTFCIPPHIHGLQSLRREPVAGPLPLATPPSHRDANQCCEGLDGQTRCHTQTFGRNRPAKARSLLWDCHQHAACALKRSWPCWVDNRPQPFFALRYRLLARMAIRPRP